MSAATMDTTTDPATETTDPTGVDATSLDGGLENDLPPGTAVCDPFIQDCPEDEKCVPALFEGDPYNDCVPITGQGEPGQPCLHSGDPSGWDDCNASSLCVNLSEVDGDLVGECAPFCTGTYDDPTCPAETVCVIDYDGSHTLCLESCDPLAPACPPGQGCAFIRPGNNAFVCVVPPEPEPSIGDPCLMHFDTCGIEQTCVDAVMLADCEAEACCAALCEVGQGDLACPIPGETCVPLLEPPLDQIGACKLMP